jgi:hypothetical protein
MENSAMRPVTARSAASRSSPPDVNFTINPEQVELKSEEEEAVVLREESPHCFVAGASAANKA